MSRLLPLIAIAALFAATSAQAQSANDYPNKPIKVVVTVPAGGGVDGVTRIVTERMRATLGQPFVIENKGGAGGNIAAMSVVNAEADGYTVYICSIGHAINQFMYPNMGYDPVADFAPVTLMCVYPNIMAVPLSSPDHSVQDYIARAKANPGKVTYCSSGVGTSLHLCGELFKRMAGVNITHIPYRGAAPALNDLIPGRTDAIFANFPSTLPYVQDGRLRGLAVTTAQRQPEVPDLPAIAEIVPGYDVSSWFALFVAAKTPPAIVEKLNRDAVEALNTPAVKERYAKLGARVVASTPAVLGAHLKSEMERWGPIIKAAGITIDKS